MNNKSENGPVSRCAALTRREFFGRCSAFAASVSALSTFSAAQANAASPGTVALPKADRKTRLRVVLAHPSSQEPCWPNIGYDFEGRKSAFMSDLKSHLPDLDFLPVTVGRDEDARALLKSGEEVDGYVLYMAGCLWGNVPE